MSDSKLFLRMTADDFNYLASQAGETLRWDNKNSDSFFEQGEAVIPDELRSKYVAADGSYTTELYNKLIEIAGPGFVSMVWHLVVDKGRNGCKENDLELPLKACEMNPPKDGTIEQCKAMMTASLEADKTRLKSGKVQGGDLHGIVEVLPRLQALGYKGVYSTSYKWPARAVNVFSSPAVHNFWVRDISERSVSPFLADPNLSSIEFLQHVYTEMGKHGMRYIPDAPWRATIPIRGAAWLVGSDVLDSGLIFKDGEVIADANIAPNQNWSDVSYDDFFAGKRDLDFTTAPQGTMDGEVRKKIENSSFYGLWPLNLAPGSKARTIYSDVMVKEASLFKQGLGGFRFDAVHYVTDETAQFFAKKVRDSIEGPETVSAECLGAGESYDDTGRCIRSFLLTDDPSKRIEPFFFGAYNAMINTFSNGSVGLGGLEKIPDVYARYNYDPRVLSGLTYYIGNQDQLNALNYVSGSDPMRRMTMDDLTSMYLFAGIAPASVYTYYASVAGLRDRERDDVNISAFSEYRPHAELPVSTDPETFTQIERTVKVMAGFREDHIKAIGFGKYEPGTKYGYTDANGHIFAVRRHILGDEVAMMVVRSTNEQPPEVYLSTTRVTLSPGMWRDRVTGQMFGVNKDGAIIPQAGYGFDLINNAPMVFDAEGHAEYGSSKICQNDALGNKFCFDAEGTSAALPDGRWMPVNPPEDDACAPTNFYDELQKGNRQSKHPYEGCASIVTKGGKVVGYQLPNKDTPVALKAQEDGYTLPDGEYFLDRGGEECSNWVTTKEVVGARQSKACGSENDEVIWVKNGRVEMRNKTRVLYLEKVAQ